MLPLGTAKADGFTGQTSGGGLNRQGAMRAGNPNCQWGAHIPCSSSGCLHKGSELGILTIYNRQGRYTHTHSALFSKSEASQIHFQKYIGMW